MGEGDAGTGQAGLPASADVLEQGSHRPQIRWRHRVAIAAILVTAALSTAFAAGYAVGNRHFRNSEAQVSRRGSVAAPTEPAGSRLTPSVVAECTAQPSLSLPVATPQQIVIPAPAPPYFSGAQAYRPKPGGSAVYVCVNSK